MSERCESCPLRSADPGGQIPCIGLSGDWDGWCQHAANGLPYWLGQVLEKSGAEVPTPPIPAIVPGSPRAMPRAVFHFKALSPADQARLYVRINLCPERRKVECGCAEERATCAKGKGQGGIVFASDCAFCLTEIHPDVGHD